MLEESVYLRKSWNSDICDTFYTYKFQNLKMKRKARSTAAEKSMKRKRSDIAQEKKPEEESIQQGDMPVSTKRDTSEDEKPTKKNTQETYDPAGSTRNVENKDNREAIKAEVKLEDVYDMTSIDWTKPKVVVAESWRLFHQVRKIETDQKVKEKDLLRYNLFRERVCQIIRARPKITETVNKTEQVFTTEEKIQYLRKKREEWLECRRNTGSAVSYRTMMSDLNPRCLQ
ncbi:hypothetical protein ScPMuIL_000176 [Solemya velum]